VAFSGKYLLSVASKNSRNNYELACLIVINKLKLFNKTKKNYIGRIRFQTPWSEQSVYYVTMTKFGKTIIRPTVKLRNCDVKNALLTPRSLKTNAALAYQLITSALESISNRKIGF